MTKLNATPGPWYVTASNDEGAMVVASRATVANWPIHGGTPEQCDNAALIAEAGTVYHETGLTPRQLAEQRSDLLAALLGCMLVAESGTVPHSMRTSAIAESASAALARAQGTKGE